MTTKLKLALAALCLGALASTTVMANPAEFVPGTPNLPDPAKPVVASMNPTPFTVPVPGTLALVAVAVLAAAAIRRRK